MKNQAIMKQICCAALINLFLGVTIAAAATQSYDVSDFTEISIKAGISADVEFKDQYSVSVETSEKELERLDVRTTGNKLIIKRKKRLAGFRRRRDPVHFTISLPALSALDASSSAKINVRDAITAGDFDLDISSSGSVIANGVFETLDIDISSSGRFNAETVRCVKANIDASSSSKLNIDEFDVGELIIDASSSASMSVAGTCDSIDMDISSSAKVDAGDLQCKHADIEASSSAKADVFASESVSVRSSSSSKVRVDGAPSSVKTKGSSGGTLTIN